MKKTERLRAAAPKEREIVLTRVFDAPRSLIFDAWTKPALLRRLHAPRGWSLVGVTWRFVVCGPDSTDMEMRGVYRETVPEPLAGAETFKDCDAMRAQGETLVTKVLVEEGGRTTLTSTVLYQSREIHDAVISSGMNRSSVEGYDKLAEILAAPEVR